MSEAAHKNSAVSHDQVHRLETPELWDRLGILASGACLVHCLAAPLLLSLLPQFWPSIDHAFHPVLAAIVLPLGTFALARGYRLHRVLWVPLLGVAGMTLLLLGARGHGGVSPITVLGSALMILAHYKNMRLSHCSRCDNHRAKSAVKA